MSPLLVKGCKISHLFGVFAINEEGSLSCHICCDTGLRFSGLIPRTGSRLVCQTSPPPPHTHGVHYLMKFKNERCHIVNFDFKLKN